MLKLVLYGQNDGAHGPDVALIGDPGTDNTTLLNAGYLGGKIAALKTSATAGRGTVLVPCDAATMTPFGFLMNGPGEFSGAIGPSGSGKISVTRALPEILVDSQAFLASDTFVVGAPVYCGSGANAGLLTAEKPVAAGAFAAPVGTVISIPSTDLPYLGVASLL
jgi:hypothetical protein